MKIPGFRWILLLLALLCILLGAGSLAFYQEHVTRQKVGSLNQTLRNPAYRDHFERDYKPAFEKLFHGDPETSGEREEELKHLLKKRFPDSSRFSFIQRDSGYAVKIYFSRACIAYIHADPEDYPDFIPPHENITATYPSFAVLWYPWD